MPLVIVTGLPCSGKTTRAKQLAEYLGARIQDKTVEVISEEDLGAHRATEYASATAEKKARGSFISTIERRVTRTNIVIADGLNYIKGYRYQLYCIARAASTPHCVLHCVAREEVCRARNMVYPAEIFEELLLRYEEPSNQARWDSPLFTVDEDDQNEWEGLAAVLAGTVARPPSMSTTVKTENSGAFLVSLDKITQEVVEQIMARIRQVGVPTSVKFGADSIIIQKNYTSGDLQRLRRQFIHMNRLHQAESENIQSLFVSYLCHNLK